MAQRAVYKSTAAEFLDDMFSGTANDLRDAYASSLELLRATAGAPLTEAAAELADDGQLPDDIGDVDTFEDDWISETGALAGKHADRLMRAAYEQALRLASERDEPVPIDTLWITTGSTDDEFEAHVCDARDRVTVVLFLPLDRPYGSERSRANSWLIRAGGTDDDGVEMLEDGDPPLTRLQRSGRRSAAN